MQGNDSSDDDKTKESSHVVGMTIDLKQAATDTAAVDY